MCQGAVVEDISDSNRLHQMFDTLSSPNVRETMILKDLKPGLIKSQQRVTMQTIKGWQG